VPTEAEQPSTMSSINKLDDIESAFKMMRKGTPDAKMLEQLLDDIVETYIDLNVKSRGGY
jgi:hypothetical protein